MAQGLSSPGSLAVAGLFLLRPVVAEHDLVGGISALAIFKGEPVNAAGSTVGDVELLEDISLVGRDIDLAHEPVVELHRDPPRALPPRGLPVPARRALRARTVAWVDCQVPEPSLCAISHPSALAR